MAISSEMRHRLSRGGDREQRYYRAVSNRADYSSGTIGIRRADPLLLQPRPAVVPTKPAPRTKQPTLAPAVRPAVAPVATARPVPRPKKSPRRLALAAVAMAPLLLAVGSFVALWQADYISLGTASSPDTQAAARSSGSVGQITLPTEAVQGEPLHVVFKRYDPGRLKAVTMQILAKPEGKEVFESGIFEVTDDQPDFSLSLNTAAFDPGGYQLVVYDQNGEEIRSGNLTLHPRQN